MLSGSFVVAGAGLFRVTAVGDQAFAQRIAGEGRRYARMRSDLQDGINGFLKVVGLAHRAGGRTAHLEPGARRASACPMG